MGEPAPTNKIYRFGVFELDDSAFELRKDGKTEPRLREQTLQILLLLLEHPREVITRDEIQKRLWSSDTFVDFDQGLNTAINQLRNALGDSAANPRFIQTLPGRGYRWVAPVEVLPCVPANGMPPLAVAMREQQLRQPVADNRSSVFKDSPAQRLS